MDSVGEGEDGKIWENGIEINISKNLKKKKRFFFFLNFGCVACGILILRIKPKLPVVEVWHLHHWTTRKFPLCIILLNTFKF